MKIFLNNEKNFVEVKSLKNVCFKSHPRWKFFVHRSVGNSKTFSISEATTGAAAKSWCGSVDMAVEALRQTLNHLPKSGVGSLEDAVEKAKERILRYVPDVKFPVNEFKVLQVFVDCGKIKQKQRRLPMYVIPNFKTKKELKEAIRDGKSVMIFSPGPFPSPKNGTAAIEGPHYPKPHSWYARVEVKNGMIVKVLA